MRSHSPQTPKMQKDKSKLHNYSPPNPPRIPATPLFHVSKNQSTATSRSQIAKKKTETAITDSKKPKNTSKITDLAKSLFDLSLGLRALSDVLSEIDNLKNSQSLSTYKHSSILTLLNTSTKCPNDVQLSILLIAKKMLKLGVPASQKVLNVYLRCSLLLLKSQCFFYSYGEDQETPQRKLNKLIKIFKEQLNSNFTIEKEPEYAQSEIDLDTSKSVSAFSVKSKVSKTSQSSKSPNQVLKTSQLSKPVTTAQKTANLRLSPRTKSPKGSQSEPVSPLYNSKHSPKKPKIDNDARSRVSTKSTTVLRKRAQSKRLSPRRERKDSLQNNLSSMKVRHYSTKDERFDLPINEIESSEIIRSNEIILDLNSSEIQPNEMNSNEIQTDPVMSIKMNLNGVLIDEEDDNSNEINYDEIQRRLLADNSDKQIFSEYQDKIDQLIELNSSKESLEISNELITSQQEKISEIQNSINEDNHQEIKALVNDKITNNQNESNNQNDINDETVNEVKEIEKLVETSKTENLDEAQTLDEINENKINKENAVDTNVIQNLIDDVAIKETTIITNEYQIKEENEKEIKDENPTKQIELSSLDANIQNETITIQDEIDQKEIDNNSVNNEIDASQNQMSQSNHSNKQNEEQSNEILSIESNINQANIENNESNSLNDSYIQSNESNIDQSKNCGDSINQEISNSVENTEVDEFNQINQKFTQDSIDQGNVQPEKESDSMNKQISQDSIDKQNDQFNQNSIDKEINQIDQEISQHSIDQENTQTETLNSNQKQDSPDKQINDSNQIDEDLNQESIDKQNDESKQPSINNQNDDESNQINQDLNQNSLEEQMKESNQKSIEKQIDEDANRNSIDNQTSKDLNQSLINEINDNDLIDRINIETEKDDAISYQYSNNSMEFDFNSPTIEIVPFTYKKERSSKQRYIFDDSIKTETKNYSIQNRSRIPIPERRTSLNEIITHIPKSSANLNQVNVAKNKNDVNKNEKQLRFGKPVSSSVLKFIKSKDDYNKRAQHGISVYQSLDNRDRIIIQKYVSQFVSWNVAYATAKNIWNEMKTNDNLDTDALLSQTPAEFGAFLVEALRIFADVEGYF